MRPATSLSLKTKLGILAVLTAANLISAIARAGEGEAINPSRAFPAVQTYSTSDPAWGVTCKIKRLLIQNEGTGEIKKLESHLLTELKRKGYDLSELGQKLRPGEQFLRYRFWFGVRYQLAGAQEVFGARLERVQAREQLAAPAEQLGVFGLSTEAPTVSYRAYSPRLEREQEALESALRALPNCR